MTPFPVTWIWGVPYARYLRRLTSCQPRTTNRSRTHVHASPRVVCETDRAGLADKNPRSLHDRWVLQHAPTVQDWTMCSRVTDSRLGCCPARRRRQGLGRGWTRSGLGRLAHTTPPHRQMRDHTLHPARGRLPNTYMPPESGTVHTPNLGKPVPPSHRPQQGRVSRRAQSYPTTAKPSRLVTGDTWLYPLEYEQFVTDWPSITVAVSR